MTLGNPPAPFVGPPPPPLPDQPASHQSIETKARYRCPAGTDKKNRTKIAKLSTCISTIDVCFSRGSPEALNIHFYSIITKRATRRRQSATISWRSKTKNSWFSIRRKTLLFDSVTFETLRARSVAISRVTGRSPTVGRDHRVGRSSMDFMSAYVYNIEEMKRKLNKDR